MILTVQAAEARGGRYVYGSSLAFLRKQKKEDMNFHTHSEKLPSQQDLEHLAPLISYHDHSALLLGKYRFIVLITALITQMIPSHFRLFSLSYNTISDHTDPPNVFPSLDTSLPGYYCLI